MSSPRVLEVQRSHWLGACWRESIRATFPSADLWNVSSPDIMPASTDKRPDTEHRMKREIPFGLFLAFAAFGRNPALEEYISFVFNLRRTSVQVTKIVAIRPYLRALCEGRELSEHLRIYRSAEYDLAECDGRGEFLTVFFGS
ncbi:uncharacterized protein P174DRAFT_288999 [Aspergillus novofumigatus IBT 16806]|uniref:Uncharacterized protein n=1 Tax=Aspergillus novofumigatus (strain IBT 16806) TaxID=1392255 RepID=A0A2I1BXG0_ASPN1|nr:uncharacterized protein P174DRAFT_288999 [Aspergillus novofumigatus IBT 16806]PKX90065.1 hypothetical protein P174DRAFT_288999 [Aspergillus novofumigatus IBT 16806]